MLGRWLPSYRKRPQRRVAAAPKFYFGDVGIVNFLARRGDLAPGGELFGKALENWCHHELSAYDMYTERYATLHYWRLAGGTEVDFIVNDMQIAIESKAAATVTATHLKGLRSLVRDHPGVKRRLVVCLEETPRTTEDGIEIVPATEFAARLWQGDYF